MVLGAVGRVHRPPPERNEEEPPGRVDSAGDEMRAEEGCENGAGRPETQLAHQDDEDGGAEAQA